MENLINPSSYYVTPKNFRDLAYNNYGKTLSELFLINYTEKLWGKAAHLLEEDIAGNRLKNLNLTSIIKSMVGVQKKDSEHLDGAFYYPKNGYGSIFEAMKKFIGKDHIKLKSKVTAIHHDGNSISGISLDNNQLINTSNVISTLPLNILIDVLRPAPPKNIIDDV